MVSKAVILAAGRGLRMLSLTAGRPKPMLEIQGKPLLAHMVGRLRKAGLQELLIVTGYRAELIEEYFSGQEGLVFRRQEVTNGTARAALLARDFAGEEDFLLSYGDIMTSPQTYREMARRLPDFEAILAVKQVEDPYQGAAVYLDGDRVIRIIEKPPRGSSTTPWNSAGIYCFRPSIFDYLASVPLSPRGEYELTDSIVALLAASRPVGYYAIPGWWRDIGRPEDLAAAEQKLAGEL